MWFFKCFVFIACVSSAFSVFVRNVIQEREVDKSLTENIVVYGIISELASESTQISSTCSTDLTNILRSINKKDMWALKVMDASGTYHGSFVWGQNAWLGSKDNCDYLNTPPKYTISPDIPKLMDKHLISTISPIEMEYKMIFLNLVSPYKVDHGIYLRTANTHRIGVCLPKSCSNRDIELLSTRFFSQQKMKFQKEYNATMEVINVRNMDIENFLNRPEVRGIFSALFIVTALVITFSIANTFLKDTKMDGLKRFFKCFSIYDNVASTFDTSSSPNAINCINGFRTFICFWVLANHCVLYTMYAYDNLPMLMSTLERIEIQPFFAIFFFVDVFFVLSALLLVFNFLKDESTLTEIRGNSIVGNLKLFLRKVVHRYIRLTPALIFTMGVSQIASTYIRESSSLYIDETFDAYCTEKGFWNNIFYIQNLFGMQNMCLSWSWYLACDMQFYIIILFIAFVYVRYPAIAKTMFVALFAVTTAVSIYLNVKRNVLPRMDSINKNLDDIYSEPWSRMHPYLAGATVGYIMFRLKDKKFPQSTFTTISCCTVWFVFLVGFLFVTSFKESTNLTFAIILSLGRYFFGLFVGSTVVMCQFGYGGIINTIFSHKIWVHFNKTTYIMYLIHPVIIMLLNSNQGTSPHFDVPTVAPIMVGIFWFSYNAAVILAPIIEIPFQKLSDEYIMKKSRTKQ